MTSGARKSRDVLSMMRMAVSGAACAVQRGQTASASSAATDPESSAVVRLSEGGALAISTVSTPAEASAIAAVRPAGPPPMTATSHPDVMRLFLANRRAQDGPGLFVLRVALGKGGGQNGAKQPTPP